MSRRRGGMFAATWRRSETTNRHWNRSGDIRCRSGTTAPSSGSGHDISGCGQERRSGAPLLQPATTGQARAVDPPGKEGVKEGVVVGHSMGGLVTRAFLLMDYERNGADVVHTYVTISSPLGGMKSAGAGIESSPIVVRSGYGLAPGSPFLDGLFYKD